MQFLLYRRPMTLRVRELMTANPVTVSTDASLLEVQRLLVVAQISGLPVAERSGAVVGVISARDVLCAVDQAIDEDEDEGEPEDVLERLRSITASQIATPEVNWVSPDASATEAAQLMRAEGVHRVLVGTRDRLEGILTAFDLLRAL